MRREFIITLLSIILISSLSSYLSSFIKIEADYVIIDTVVDDVGAGNFNYWQLGHEGPLVIELLSITGDADLYVSDTVAPSYEVDKNNFSSVTCGIDVVEVPADFPRPVCIGVFGHWSHVESQYTLQVFQDVREFVSSNRDSSQLDGTHAPEGDAVDSSDKVWTHKSAVDAHPKYLSLLSGILDVFFDLFAI